MIFAGAEGGINEGAITTGTVEIILDCAAVIFASAEPLILPAVNKPDELIEPSEASFTDHWGLKSLEVLSPYIALQLNCSVPPGLTVALAGVIERDLRSYLLVSALQP